MGRNRIRCYSFFFDFFGFTIVRSVLRRKPNNKIMKTNSAQHRYVAYLSGMWAEIPNPNSPYDCNAIHVENTPGRKNVKIQNRM